MTVWKEGIQALYKVRRQIPKVHEEQPWAMNRPSGEENLDPPSVYPQAPIPSSMCFSDRARPRAQHISHHFTPLECTSFNRPFSSPDLRISGDGRVARACGRPCWPSSRRPASIWPCTIPSRQDHTGSW